MKLFFGRFRAAGRVAATIAICLPSSWSRLEANPTRPVVTQGTATVSGSGSQLTVQTSRNAYINWATFNIGAGESTVFVQPSASSVVWNRINDPNPSQILGRLDANGLVVLQNQSGFYVGGQAVINAAGLIMTTSPTPAPDLSGGGMWQFNAPPPSASIINYGQINSAFGGPIFLIAHDIESHGTLTAPGGDIGLYAGKQVLVSSRPDGRGLSAQISLPEGSVDNTGKLIADAGTIALHAQVVNQGGLIQANSVRQQNGVIELVAGDTLTVGPSSVITAKGDAQGVSPGGSVLIQSGNKFADDAASSIDVSGGAAGGNGGQVEISAPQMDAIRSHIDGHAAPGWTGGKLIIDPINITLSSTGTTAGSGTVNEGDAPDSLTLNVASFSAFSQILLQASQNITLSTAWSLADSAVSAVLTLQAGNNIVLNNNLTAGLKWTVNLIAGADFVTPTSVTPGLGSLTLTGNATVQAQDGNINAVAGNSVAVANGAIRTMNKGSINVTAVTGSVNAGKNSTGYSFKTTGYTVSANLGGISTAAGGDVTITAGGDVTSFLPPNTTSTSPTDAGSGAFGPAPGVVTIKAGFNALTGLPSLTGGSVFGHFVAADSERNGQVVASTITAYAGTTSPGNAGVAANLLALSLVKGGWQVNAPNGSIFLQEVRNPNGVFNGTGFGVAPFKHLFDYDANSFLDLEAGNAVVLGAPVNQGPRYTGDAVPIILPPTLTINAGSGGVTLGNNLTLFPSPFGELNITTAPLSGGSLEGAGFTLAMSDSGATKWTSGFNFATDHAANPVQFNNPNPVRFNISGNVENITITTPKATQITVGGDMNNTSFSGQNLHPTDVTSLDVTGKIIEQNIYSFVTLDAPLKTPDARFPADTPGYLQVLLDAVIPNSGPASANGGQLFPNLSFFYIPATKQIGYVGPMDAAHDPVVQALLAGAFQVKTYTSDGKAVLDANGNYVTKTAVLGVDPQKMSELVTASQNSITLANAASGFTIGGPGLFKVTAQSLDLGVAVSGITSEGPAINHSLAKLAGAGAGIKITLAGDLELFSSRISSLYGGSIDITSSGAVNLGFQGLPLADPKAALGIWTSGPGNVTIDAQGDVNVDGSRIAAFDGGTVSVTSETGNVDAGSGGFNAVLVNEVIVTPGAVPGTFTVTTRQQPIAGSGILATTLPDAPSNLKVGDIHVTTPQGSITASQGGIVQEPLNGNASLTPTLTLNAGTRDAHGNVVHPGDINAGGSGVIGVNTLLNAAGNINGLVIARGDSTVNAAVNVSGTFLAGGTASFNAGGTVSGIAIAGNAINVGSGTFEGVALSQSVSGGNAQSALASSSTASASAQAAGAQQESAAQKADNADPGAGADEDEKKRKGLRPLLAKYVGRVTVILPSDKK